MSVCGLFCFVIDGKGTKKKQGDLVGSAFRMLSVSPYTTVQSELVQTERNPTSTPRIQTRNRLMRTMKPPNEHTELEVQELRDSVVCLRALHYTGQLKA
jgi:hypothetical protein